MQSVSHSVVGTDPPPSAQNVMSAKDKSLMEAAQKLEATFLAEMLKAAGLGESRSDFGGGAGEDQFGSMLVQEQAMAMARSGGIGLSEHLFEALKEREK